MQINPISKTRIEIAYTFDVEQGGLGINLCKKETSNNTNLKKPLESKV